jgi:hypothetical protein
VHPRTTVTRDAASIVTTVHRVLWRIRPIVAASAIRVRRNPIWQHTRYRRVLLKQSLEPPIRNQRPPSVIRDPRSVIRDLAKVFGRSASQSTSVDRDRTRFENSTRSFIRYSLVLQLGQVLGWVFQQRFPAAFTANPYLLSIHADLYRSTHRAQHFPADWAHMLLLSRRSIFS